MVRPLGASDARRYRVLRLASLRNFQLMHGPAYEDALRQDEAWHAARLAKAGDYWFGAFDGDELVGTIALRTQEGSRLRHSASLNSLIVDSSRQARGIGRLLIAHLIDFARSLGTIRQITLALTDGNARAERLYEAFGFKLFGLEPDALLHEGRYYGKQHRQLILDHSNNE
ncbi:GNAT family N-acetyltransferase [Massilia agilis]|uniref:GNAT family N-acetyltransferase n=1 Tax=Massilia agilis TaxID=1811226 RepID=A0ABT2DBF1_9BURK|nr:GNAT family N-acetyltransferase [Massilia agilis]